LSNAWSFTSTQICILFSWRLSRGSNVITRARIPSVFRKPFALTSISHYRRVHYAEVNSVATHCDNFSLLAFPKMSNLIAFSFSLCSTTSLCLTSFVHFTLSRAFLLTQHTLPSSFISVRSSYSSSFTCSNSKADWHFSFLFQQ